MWDKTQGCISKNKIYLFIYNVSNQEPNGQL